MAYASHPQVIEPKQIAMIRGITNRIEGELQRREGGSLPFDLEDERRALRSAAALYRQLVEQSGDGIVVVDGASMRILEVNESVCVLTGYSREELLQLKTSDLVLPEDLPTLLQAISALDEGARVEATRRLRRRDGSLFWSDITSKSLSDGRRLSIVRNVSERIRMEERAGCNSRKSE